MVVIGKGGEELAFNQSNGHLQGMSRKEQVNAHAIGARFPAGRAARRGGLARVAATESIGVAGRALTPRSDSGIFVQLQGRGVGGGSRGGDLTRRSEYARARGRGPPAAAPPRVACTYVPQYIVVPPPHSNPRMIEIGKRVSEPRREDRSPNKANRREGRSLRPKLS